MKVLSIQDCHWVGGGDLDGTAGEQEAMSYETRMEIQGGSSYSTNQFASGAGCVGTVIGSGIAVAAPTTTPLMLLTVSGAGASIIGACSNSFNYWVGSAK